MTSYTIARLTIYALISSLEEDLRDLIKSGFRTKVIDPYHDTFIDKAKERYEKDNESSCPNDLDYLCEYFDFAENFIFINKYSSYCDREIAVYVKEKTPSFEKIVPIRNRAMHTRPLEIEDVPTASEIARVCCDENPSYWKATKKLLDKMRSDPSFILSIEIPTSAELSEKTHHNIPFPEYVETGLIGRKAEISKLKKAFFGPFPIISIIGSGGVGKTSLAQKLAFDIIDDERNEYDSIIWVSSKTTRLEINEIKEINGAIKTSVGVISKIVQELGGDSRASEIEEVIEYLKLFKIAIFIDNLETVLDKTMTDFLESIAEHSKIVITSRIGLGAMDFQIKLDALEQSSAVNLMRALIRFRNITHLASLNESNLVGFCRKMNYNPLFIKWFATAAQKGIPAENIINDSNVFLQYCVDNVYDRLGANSKIIISVLQTLPGEKNISEISYISQITALPLLSALQEILSANLILERIRETQGTQVTYYSLSETARSYLSRFSIVNESDIKSYARRNIELTSPENPFVDENHSDENSFYYIIERDRGDRPIVKMLKDSLLAIRRKDFGQAQEILDNAQHLSPNYSEIYRVQALLFLETGKFGLVREKYEAALSFAPGDYRLYSWYAGFKFRYDENYESAIQDYQKSLEINPKQSNPKFEIARIHLIGNEFVKAAEQLKEIDIASLSSKNRRKCYDLSLQIRTRYSSGLFKSGNFDEFVESLNDVKTEYLRIPVRDRDYKIRDRLKRLDYCIQRTIPDLLNKRVLPIFEDYRVFYDSEIMSV